MHSFCEYAIYICCSPVVTVGIGRDTMKRKNHLGEQQGDLSIVHLGGQSLGNLGEQAWHLGGHLDIWASWESAVGSK